MNDKSVVLKVYPNDIYKDEDEMDYLTRRFQNIVKKQRGFQNKGTTSKTKNANDLCHKCGKLRNFMRDCQSHKHEVQDLKPQRNDQIPNHTKRKANAYQVVMKDFAL